MPWPIRTGPEPMTSAAGRGTGRRLRRRARRPRTWRRSRASRRRTPRRTCRPSRSRRTRPVASRAARMSSVGDAGQPGQLAIAEAGPLGRGEQRHRLAVVGSAIRAPAAATSASRATVAAHLGQEPGRDPGRLLDVVLRDAAPQQGEDPPQARVGRGEEAAQDDRRGGPLGQAGRLARLAVGVHPARSASPAAASGRRPGRRAIHARATGRQVVERRPPRRVLGQRPGAGLLQAAERLVERRPERPVDRHHLAGRLHLAAQACGRRSGTCRTGSAAA